MYSQAHRQDFDFGHVTNVSCRHVTAYKVTRVDVFLSEAKKRLVSLTVLLFRRHRSSVLKISEITETSIIISVKSEIASRGSENLANLQPLFLLIGKLRSQNSKILH